MARWIPRIGALVGLVLAGCDQTPATVLGLDAVWPSEVAAGQQRSVVLVGRFAPRVSWELGSGPRVEDDFRVSFGALDADGVRLAAPDRLVARLPAGLGAGCQTVRVRGPDGAEAVLGEGLCARTVADTRMLLAGRASPTAYALLDASVSQIGGGVTVTADMVPLLADWSGAFQVDDNTAGYALEPERRRLAYLRDVPDATLPAETPLRRELWLADLDDLQAGHVLLAARPQAERDAGGDVAPVALGGLRFSPTGDFLLVLEEHRRLLRFEVPAPGGEPGEPVAVAEAPDEGTRLHFPDVDPTGRQALYTLSTPDPEGGLDGFRVELHLVDLEDGVDRRLDTGMGARFQDGPGSFAPLGDRVLFVSSRSGLWLPSPFLSMVPATSLYSAALDRGQVVEPAQEEAPQLAGFIFGRPEVSADGRFVACQGMLSDLTGSGLDILVVDRQEGGLQRIGRDGVNDSTDPSGVRFCMPEETELAPDGGLVCAQPGARLACCEADGCCGFQDDELRHCPTINPVAAFGPDSKMLMAQSLPVSLVCSEISRWGMQFMGVELLMSQHLTIAGGQGGWFFELLSAADVGVESPLAPRLYQVLADE